jgi:LAGLIDADG endonuclease
MGAGNQQGRPDEALGHYVAGFVDGEGSFHLAVQRNSSTRWKWQVIPEFHVSQNDGNQHVLQLIRAMLGCGYLKPNHRNSRDRTYVLVVRDRNDLVTKVVPFFKRYELRTTKRAYFERFALIVDMMKGGRHLTLDGLREILRIAFVMNQGGIRRRITLDGILACLEPSETVRRTLTEVR